MESNVKVSFWLNRSKKDSKGLVPVYLRVTYNSLRLHKSTGVHIKAEDWDASVNFPVYRPIKIRE